MTKFPYKRVFSYGCSITAGTELGDAALLGMTDDQLKQFVKANQIVGTQDLYGKLGATNKTIGLINTVNASFSWPNYVAEHFNIPLYNRAIGGSSLSSATHEILKDLHASIINDDDLILVGITGPGRWFQYSDNGKTAGGVAGQYSWPNTPLEYQKQLEQNFFNRHNLMYNHYKELAFISNLSDRLNGQIKMCYAVNSPSMLENIFHLKEKEFVGFYDFCCSIFPTHNLIEKTVCLTELAGRSPGNFHPFWHPKVEFHKKFANILIENLEKMYND